MEHLKQISNTMYFTFMGFSGGTEVMWKSLSRVQIFVTL